MGGINLFIILPCFILLSSSLLPALNAVQYTVTNNVRNTPGGKVFDQNIGVNFALQTLANVNAFIWKTLQENTQADRNNVSSVNVYINSFDNAYAYTSGNNIYLSGPGIDKYYFPRNRSRFYFASLMYHEMTHVFQWTANYAAPTWLIEGIADYVMVKSTFYEPDKYPKPGAGNRWDEGYGVTERFLEYCDSLKNGFTAALNKKMRYKYSDNYFAELLGKPVDQLWKDYKAKYGKVNDASASDAMFPGAKY